MAPPVLLLSKALRVVSAVADVEPALLPPVAPVAALAAAPYLKIKLYTNKHAPILYIIVPFGSKSYIY